MPPGTRYARKRCFKLFDKLRFKAEVEATSWFSIYMCTDVNEAVKQLTDKLTMILDKHAPVRTIQVRKNYAPWLSDLTKLAIKKRNIAQQVSRLTKNHERIREYKNIQNQVNNMMKRDRINWEKAKLDHPVNSDTDLWQSVKKSYAMEERWPTFTIISQWTYDE